MKIVFFPVGNFYGASTRYRVYFIAKELEKHGISTTINYSTFPAFPIKKSCFKKVYLQGKDFFKKVIEIIKTNKNDIIFVQKAIFLYGYPVLEIFAKKILKRRMIYDLDDALFLGDSVQGIQANFEPLRTRTIIKISDIVIVGSHYLKEYSEKYNKNVFLIPSSTDTKKYKLTKREKNQNIVIGWIGSPSTLKYLKILIEPLDSLGKKYDIEFRIIGANEYEENVPEFKNVKIKLVPWKLETEWEEISKFDIGVMPLFNGEWEKGKCGFKAIQYMTLCIPAVCSAVGENKYIINDGIDGFLCENKKDWVDRLSSLIEDKQLRNKMGKEGRKTVEKKYSLEANGKRLVEIIESHLMRKLKT